MKGGEQSPSNVIKKTSNGASKLFSHRDRSFTHKQCGDANTTAESLKARLGNLELAMQSEDSRLDVLEDSANKMWWKQHGIAYSKAK